MRSCKSRSYAVMRIKDCDFQISKLVKSMLFTYPNFSNE